MHIQLGDLAEWVAAVGTVGALWATYSVIRRDHRRQDEQHEEQLYDEARLVTASFGYVMVPGPPPAHVARNRVQVTVTNDGRRPIHDVRAALWTMTSDPPTEASANVLPAGAVMTFDAAPIPELMLPTGGYNATCSVEFTDIAGHRWRRTSKGYLVPLSAPSPVARRWPVRRRTRRDVGQLPDGGR